METAISLPEVLFAAGMTSNKIQDGDHRFCKMFSLHNRRLHSLSAFCCAAVKWHQIVVNKLSCTGREKLKKLLLAFQHDRPLSREFLELI